MKEIFVSRPNWIPEKFENGINSFYNFLKANELNPRTIGQSDYPNKSPLDEVIGLLKKCEGTIVLGIPQIEITSGVIKGKKIVSNLQLGTEWNHIEAALSHSLDLPMLIIHHETVERGIFDRGACNSFLHSVNMEKLDWATSDGISGALLNWKSELKGAKINSSVKNYEKLKPTLKWGAYKFGAEPGLFCPVCYEKEDLKIPISRIDRRIAKCPNCKAQLS